MTFSNMLCINGDKGLCLRIQGIGLMQIISDQAENDGNLEAAFSCNYG